MLTDRLDCYLYLVIKAGKIVLIFPKEAFKKDAIYSLDKNWIEKNIYDYLYLNKECDKVFISKNDSILPF